MNIPEQISRRFGEGLAIVLGGNGWIGSQIVKAFADEGVDVVFTSRRPGEARSDMTATSRARTSWRQLDLLDSAAISALFDSLASRNRVHSIVFAAGIEVPQRYMSNAPREEWLRAMQFEVTSFFDVMQAAVKVMKLQAGGSLVALTSSAIHRYASRDGLSAVPKSAVEMLVRAVAKEEGRFGIRANCVAPGLMEGGIGLQVIDEIDNPALLTRVKSSTPLRRLMTPLDVANAAVFLASDAAAGITGQTIVVDGGQSV